MASMPRRVVRDAARELLRAERERLTQDAGRGEGPEDARSARAAVLAKVVSELPSAAARLLIPGPRPVVNATGIVLHTNLGRAPLPEPAIQAISECARNYTDLEFDLETGDRGSRQAHVSSLACRAFGARGAYVVNNNAAAVLLCLDTLARGREVPVSRGELVEIGGSFRIPEIMARSGATLVEVGTTNRTRLSDYAAAVRQETALILKVHTSNFRVVGFTEEASPRDLVSLGRARGIPVMYDLGSGAATELSQFNLGHEPTVGDALSAGVDLVTVSGDKLLGGPQCGLILGRPDLIEKIARNPLARALRIDKLSLAALCAVLASWADPDEAIREIPVMSMLTSSRAELVQRAHSLADMTRQALREAGLAMASEAGAPAAREAGPGQAGETARVFVEVIDDPSEAGGGSMPGVSIPGASVAVQVEGFPPQDLSELLRLGRPPVIARVAGNSVRLHLRTIFDRDFSCVAHAVARAAATALGEALK
jgi:L-seryl-tRNA(Ser) seleniumtransferase